jgi:hypothetical protein
MPRTKDKATATDEHQKAALKKAWEAASPSVQRWFIQTSVRKVFLEGMGKLEEELEEARKQRAK